MQPRLSYVKTTAEKTIVFETFDKKVLAVRFSPTFDESYQVTVFRDNVPIYYLQKFGSSTSRCAKNIAEQAMKELTKTQ